jgi:hypothetical protein
MGSATTSHLVYLDWNGWQAETPEFRKAVSQYWQIKSRDWRAYLWFDR